MALRLVKNTEPYVQRFHEPYWETDMGPQGPAGVGLCVLCQPIISNLITMATFDVSGVLYRDPETGCASTSGNQIAYEECRQSYYAKQQTQKSNTAPIPTAAEAGPKTDATLNAKIDSLEREVQQLQFQQPPRTESNSLQLYYPYMIIGLLVIITGMVAIQIIQLKRRA